MGPSTQAQTKRSQIHTKRITSEAASKQEKSDKDQIISGANTHAVARSLGNLGDTLNKLGDDGMDFEDDVVQE